jgi:iron complex transport system permease protein
VLAPAVILGFALSIMTIKHLNMLLLGEEYAITMGLKVKQSRMLIFLSTILLAGSVTAFCGPIGFIGLAMPHVARLVFNNSDHRILLPGTMILGGMVLLVCDIVSKFFTLPINSITALLGIPIVMWLVMRNKTIAV